ncbi:hypothetical protein VTG60DRAFT_6853 [Thermothelomyces hinnuleus]
MTGRAPGGGEQLNEIAKQAERDLNTYQSKTGHWQGAASSADPPTKAPAARRIKTAHVYQHNPGEIDEATVRGWGKDPRELERAALLRDDSVLPADQAANVGISAENRKEVPAQGSRGSQFEGEYYQTPEFVPDQRADQGAIPPASVTETSKNI